MLVLNVGSASNNKSVAYFCAEFGIDNELPTYAGGLGVLAGDFMHACADKNRDVTGIGILYRGKEFMQQITSDGKEEKRDSEFDHDSSFLRQTTMGGKPLVLEFDFHGTIVKAKPYQLRLSDKTVLYLLSTNVDGNPPEWISDMDKLYGGDTNSQIRQQILLGVGGVKLLNKLRKKIDIYHINEGRPSVLIWELVKIIMKEKSVDFDSAWNMAKQKIVYTNHTLVDAGNPKYESGVVEKWASYFAEKMQVDTNLLIKDGLINPQLFDLTHFALNISNKHSSVSKVHGEYANKMWPDFNFVSITNGVHLPRWQDSDFRSGTLSDHGIWELHMLKKRELAETVLKRCGISYDHNKLVITWARRLAEYKQPKMIFSDIERLKKILFNEKGPVQLLFAGNTHSGDPHSKALIEDIIKLFSEELSGGAIFVPNYNLSLANHLVSGSDVWLNTPKGNLEACGTSGMKAISNGVLNLTVLDGWTYEANWKDIGWTLDPKDISHDFYSKMETEIVPLFYNRKETGLPQGWIERMKRSVRLVKEFSAERMVDRYYEKLYI